LELFLKGAIVRNYQHYIDNFYSWLLWTKSNSQKIW